MTDPVLAAQALGDAALDAISAGLATGRVGSAEAVGALVRALARSPGSAARAGALAGELASVAAGRPASAATTTALSCDPRFADPAWQENPLYRRLGQAYLATAKAITATVDAADLDWRQLAQARFAAGVVVSALAPTNTLAGNPAALRRAFDTAGLSLVRGARNLLADARAGRRTPCQADRRPFLLGENTGATPGAVVFRNEVVEVIQYAPSTPTVRTVPLLIVWSLINRFYILDLAPGRSFIEYAVGQGIPVFVTSWRNPRREHAGWDLDTYASALIKAITAVRQITGSPQVGTMGLCAGGQLLAALLAHLADSDEHRDTIGYACFGVTQLDLSVPSAVAMAISPPSSGLARLASGASGLVDGRDIAAVFSWLRPDELVWSYWVNNYLMGADPPAFDILAWNADTTRMPGALQRQLLQIADRNLLAEPDGMRLLGSDVDLARSTVDSYVIGAETDHLVPWRGAYRTTALLGGDATFVLSGGGHIQHLVNPPGTRKARYRTGPVPRGEPDAWLADATSHEGSWWGHWAAWIHARSGALRPAPAALGSCEHPPVERAPGSYVRQR